jgi:hypothetical protein
MTAPAIFLLATRVHRRDLRLLPPQPPSFSAAHRPRPPPARCPRLRRRLVAPPYHRPPLVYRRPPKLLQLETSSELLTATAPGNPNIDSSLPWPPPALNHRSVRQRCPPVPPPSSAVTAPPSSPSPPPSGIHSNKASRIAPVDSLRQLRSYDLSFLWAGPHPVAR